MPERILVPSVLRAVLLLVLAAITMFPARASAQTLSKLDPLLHERVGNLTGSSQVIVQAIDPASISLVGQLVEQVGGTLGRSLPIVGGVVANLPDRELSGLTANPLVLRIALDRRIAGTMERTAAVIGAAAACQQLGYDGSGVGVAVIDSGVTSWHDDLTSPAVAGSQRVDGFIDFVNGQTDAYDDYGHGTHVAGIIAGNGFDSGGARSGIAPGARLLALKVLDGSGRGRISNVIAAIDYVVSNRSVFNTRVINLSVGAGVFESYHTDLLAQAALRAVEAGIVVVASAGNFGKDSAGRARYGSITAPGNAPWVLTVGASSHMGTVDRGDDIVASFSSRGPTTIDNAAKPDLVAPGVGIESLSDPSSLFFTSKAWLLLNGTVQTAYAPYLSLSGTSQSAPVVAGVIALMLQANPSLTPNAVKAILQYTAEAYPGYDLLTQGAGFVNARGAVELSRYLAAPSVNPYPDTSGWRRRLIWGNQIIETGRLAADASAWATGVVWGAATMTGEFVAWNENRSCADPDCVWIVSVTPSTTTVLVTTIVNPLTLAVTTTTLTITTPAVSVALQSENVVWGSGCGGANCTSAIWTPADGVTWGTSDDGETVVWGSTDDGDTVVWGSTGDEDVLWGDNNNHNSCEEPDLRPVI